MGLLALRMQPRTRTRGPRLRLVVPQRTPARKPSRAAQAAVARRNFQMFALLTVVLATLGVGRVWMSVQATEASLDANELRTEIKAERYVGDMLEVRQSALGSPSRIRAIAGKAMDMAPASEVTYLDLTKGGPPAGQRRERSAAVSADPVTREVARAGIDGVLARILDLTAGEAQVLLVGDVGLSSSR